MSELPRISGGEAVAAFEKAGFVVDRVTGSHHILKKPGWRYRLSIPVHGKKVLGKGLLASQIVAAGMTVDEFRALLNR